MGNCERGNWVERLYDIEAWRAFAYWFSSCVYHRCIEGYVQQRNTPFDIISPRLSASPWDILQVVLL